MGRVAEWMSGFPKSLGSVVRLLEKEIEEDESLEIWASGTVRHGTSSEGAGAIVVTGERVVTAVWHPLTKATYSIPKAKITGVSSSRNALGAVKITVGAAEDSFWIACREPKASAVVAALKGGVHRDSRPSPSQDPSEQLERLAKMFESGLLSDDEFLAAKKKALGL